MCLNKRFTMYIIRISPPKGLNYFKFYKLAYTTGCQHAKISKCPRIMQQVSYRSQCKKWCVRFSPSHLIESRQPLSGLTGLFYRTGWLWGGEETRGKVTLRAAAAPLHWNRCSVTIWHIQNLINKHTHTHGVLHSSHIGVSPHGQDDPSVLDLLVRQGGGFGFYFQLWMSNKTKGKKSFSVHTI